MIVITEKGNHDYYELKDYFIECEYEDIVKVAKEVLANYDYYYNKLFANFDIIKIHSNHKRLIDEFLEKSSKNDRMDVVIAILVKDKEATLPRFITCLLNQTFPKERTRLYIRTNDNTDKSEEILSSFITEHTSKYKSVFYDRTSVSEELKKYKAHEWNAQRFKILGKIRDDSVKYALEHNAHYFVIDIDNFIVPSTLDDMLAVSSLGVIAPMLVTKSAYSNYHSSVDNNGYLKTDDLYLRILNKNIKGCIDVPVVHCTYFIANNILDKVSYDDGSFRYEYVVFSDVLRKQNIPQYIDNRKDYGRISFATTKEEFEDDWAQYQSIFTQV